LASFVHVKLQRRHRVALIMLGLGLGLALAMLVGVPVVGAFLVVADPLAPADAIFVLAGGTPTRELEGAALYHLKLAPTIVLSRGYDRFPVALQLAGEPTRQERAARVLAHTRIPATAVARLDREVHNTAEELAAGFEYARTRGFRRVILVTSPVHTRRVRVIWNARYQRTIPALVAPTSYETWDPQRWWRSRHSLQRGMHELVGIGHFLIGSPIPTFDRGR
jgi:uncharacterized SAM-binding protein YcdF (DUF218 family)